MDIFEHDYPEGKYAIGCRADYGSIFGLDKIFIKNKWDQHFFFFSFFFFSNVSNFEQFTFSPSRFVFFTQIDLNIESLRTRKIL